MSDIHNPYVQRWGKRSSSVLLTGHILEVLEGKHMRGKTRTIYFDHPQVRTLDDMSEEEIGALEKQYGCRVTKK